MRVHPNLPAGRTLVFAATMLFAAGAAPALAQQAPVAARAGDVSSMDSIIAVLYAVISGPAGQARDWDRFRSLFVPGARLIPTSRNAQGQVSHRVLTPDEYAAGSGPFLEGSGFTEREIARRVESFGNITHAFSTYASEYRDQQGQARTARGINSIQLLNDGKRWWIVTIFWDSERPDNPIPAKYLSGGE